MNLALPNMYALTPWACSRQAVGHRQKSPYAYNATTIFSIVILFTHE